MKHKKIKIAAALVVVGLISGVIYNQVTAKKSYDYSDYYVETKTTKKESIKENEEASEKELSLSLLKQTNKDVVGILEFDDRIIYEPIVQAQNNDYYVRKNINKEYANAGIPFVSADGNIDSKNVVIYGHSSKWDNIIFTPLMSYTDQNYYKKHDTFKFITENETRTYQIFGVMNIDLNDLNATVYNEQPGLSYRSDGNNVDVSTENVELAKNQIKYYTLMNSISQEFSRMKSALKTS